MSEPQFIRIPNTDPNQEGVANAPANAVVLQWPIDPVTQGTLKRWLNTVLPSGDFSETIENLVNDSVAGDPTSGEIYIPSEAMNPTTTSGCAALAKIEAGSNDVDYWVLDFDQTSAESCFFTIRFPDDWNALTVTFRFIWTTAGGGSSETVDWGVKGRCFADDDAIDQAYGSEVTTTDTRIANNDVHISAESTAVTLAGTPAAGQWAQFKITRKVSTDNLASDARLIGVRLKYGRA